jgi:oxygen-independent coproporphyrinogen-3 oxidase
LAGIYLHIPFCRKLCYYCDFHFTVSLKNKQRVINALVNELNERVEEGSYYTFDTIYFGGGTPSVLNAEELNQIFDTIYKNYKIGNSPEISFEANPDDLTKDYLTGLKKFTPVNRLSIGIQSFVERDLVFLNRRHSSTESIEALERTKKAGFNNINIDLIYGIPGLKNDEWKRNLETFRQLEIPHLSAYHLTIEPKTVFGHYQKKGKLKPVDEEVSLEQFKLLMDFAGLNGYEHYEISNFARDKAYSRHNLGYWTGKEYLGFGPSAHSFIPPHRRWNVANNSQYCELIENKSRPYFETEEIDQNKAYNEYILTSLRTQWGINLEFILETFGSEYATTCKTAIKQFLPQGILRKEQNDYTLNRKGILIADFVISRLMIVK